LLSEEKNKMPSKLRIYSDGGSRGNPGPSAIAFMIVDDKGKILKRHSKYLGICTNNQAEYEALIEALEFAAGQQAKEVVCFLDSELVTKHLTGEYKVKDPKLKTLWLKMQEIKQNFATISFVRVPRTQCHVQEVDRLVNETLDKAS